MTGPGAKAGAASIGAASVDALPSQVSEDGWVRADQLTEALAKHVGRDVSPELLAHVRAAIGSGRVGARYADDVGRFREGKPDHYMGSEGRAMRVRPVIAHVRRFAEPGRRVEIGNEVSMHWPTGLCGLQCTYGYEERDQHGHFLAIHDETRWLPIGPVELAWFDMLTVIDAAPGSTKSTRLPRSDGPPLGREGKAREVLRKDKVHQETIYRKMIGIAHTFLDNSVAEKRMPKGALVIETAKQAKCSQDEARLIYAERLPKHLKNPHGGQRRQSSKTNRKIHGG